MSDFPWLRPATRQFSFGQYPVSLQTGFGGGTVRFLHGIGRSAVTMELTYENLTQAEAKLIRDHYRLRQGSHQDFFLPELIWAGHSTAYNIVPQLSRWKYGAMPEETQKRGGYVDLTVTLVCVTYITSMDVFAPGMGGQIDFLLSAGSATGGGGGGGGGGETDPDFSSVVLLLPFDGANNSTTFTDESNNNLTVTTSGAPIISTAQSKWGGSSLYLNGSSRLQIASNPLFAFNDFTVEMWIYKTGSDDSGRDTVFDLNSLEATIVTGSSLAGRANINGTQLTGTFTTADNTWQHLALVRSGSSCWLFRDGSIIASATISGQLTAGQIYIGDSVANPGRNFIGYVDDLRISNIARYTTGFTPPAAAFPTS